MTSREWAAEYDQQRAKVESLRKRKPHLASRLDSATKDEIHRMGCGGIVMAAEWARLDYLLSRIVGAVGNRE